MEDVNPSDSHQDIEQPHAYQEKNGAYDTRRADVWERGIGGSWKNTPYKDFKVGDHVLLRYPKEFYGYFGNLQARKDWGGPFTI